MLQAWLNRLALLGRRPLGRKRGRGVKSNHSEKCPTLLTAVSISAEAVRNTQGRERELWKAALESELTSLEDNRVLYKVSSERALEPLLFRLGVKRKARIVACGNFIGQYETYDVSNLDVAVFRCVLQVVAKRKLRVGVVDIRTAFMHAGIGS
eukprot:6463784-Amphidinium_carterae.3